MGNVLTLEDFNTLLRVYGDITSEYTIDSSVFDGEGKYDFLDVTVHTSSSGSRYVVEVVNSLFTGVYTVITGRNVVFSNNKFAFNTNQNVKIKILLGANSSSKFEFDRFVARPVHESYTCHLVAKDVSGNILPNKTVYIGIYSGTTDSNGEVDITIPPDKADIYQLPVRINDFVTFVDTLELLRTKITLSPTCITDVLDIGTSTTLSFHVGDIGHSVSCKCVVDGYTYTANSDAETGIVSFNLNDINESIINYSLKVLADDWVYESNITGTVECEYYTVTSFEELQTAYNNGVSTVKIQGTITLNSPMELSRDFTIIGGENNLLTGNAYFYMTSSDKTLKLDNVNTDDLDKLVIAGPNNVVLENCNFESSSREFVRINLGGTVTSNNCEYMNMQSPIFYCFGGVLNITNSYFFVTDLSKTSTINPCVAKAYGTTNQYPATTMNFSYSTIAIDISEVSEDVGLRPSFFDFNINTTFNGRNYTELLFDDTLPTDTLTGDVNFRGGGIHYTSRVPGRGFIWSYNGRLYKKNVKEE